jgi:hypothetical protein
MTPLARSWLRRIALGLPLVIAPAASPLVVTLTGCGPCSGNDDRTFAIDAVAAAQILDMSGHATTQGCRNVCSQIVMGAVDGGGADVGASDADVMGVASTSAASCDVVSNGTNLEVTCHFVRGCPGGRRPDGLVDGRDTCRSAGEWLARMAWMEAASVDAFEQLAVELTRLGAPRSLARDAHAAATDERRHARSIARLARARGHEAATPRVRASRARSIEALAVDNAIEGGVRETFGALLAAHQATTATDEDVRRAMHAIARDEASHALLSARIDAWARTRVDGTLLDAARRDAVRTLASSIDAECDDVDATRLGLPTVEQQRALVLALA